MSILNYDDQPLQVVGREGTKFWLNKNATKEQAIPLIEEYIGRSLYSSERVSFEDPRTIAQTRVFRIRRTTVGYVGD